MWNTSISPSLLGGKDSRKVAACLCWWTTRATEELSNLENIRDEKKKAVSPPSPRGFTGLSLWKYQRKSRQSPTLSKWESHVERGWKHINFGGQVTGKKLCKEGLVESLTGHHAGHDQAVCPYSKDSQEPPGSWSFPSTQHWWATARAQATELGSQYKTVSLAMSFCFALLNCKWFVKNSHQRGRRWRLV